MLHSLYFQTPILQSRLDSSEILLFSKITVSSNLLFSSIPLSISFLCCIPNVISFSARKTLPVSPFSFILCIRMHMSKILACLPQPCCCCLKHPSPHFISPLPRFPSHFAFHEINYSNSSSGKHCHRLSTQAPPICPVLPLNSFVNFHTTGSTKSCISAHPFVILQSCPCFSKYSNHKASRC